MFAGASFFYKPGTLPYEAQEVRAFGLFLSDMLARVEGTEKASSVRAGLEDIAAGALHKDPLSRISFEAIAAQCSRLTKVLQITAWTLSRKDMHAWSFLCIIHDDICSAKAGVSAGI